jgi:type II secretory pathway pseudopilin PulG
MLAGNQTILVRQTRSQYGFTYLILLLAMTLLALATQGVMTYASQQAQRVQEADLIHIGETYQRAIAAYYESSPGKTKQWPRQLQDLLEDRRHVSTKRHLRSLYSDPVTRAEWGLLYAADGGISGVHSKSDKPTISTRGIPTKASPRSSQRYSDWHFVYQPENAPLQATYGSQPGAPR